MSWTRSCPRSWAAVLLLTAIVHGLMLLLLGMWFSAAATAESVSQRGTVYRRRRKISDSAGNQPQSQKLWRKVDPPAEQPMVVASIIPEQEQPNVIDINDLEPALEIQTADPNGPLANIKQDTGGRSGVAKSALLSQYGGSAASELAVGRGLQWIASIQRKDGSWSFRDVGESGQPGHRGKRCHARDCLRAARFSRGRTYASGGRPLQTACATRA